MYAANCVRRYIDKHAGQTERLTNTRSYALHLRPTAAEEGSKGDGIRRGMCLGVGEPLSPERTRMLLALRINVLAKGHSGISLNTLQQYVAAFNGKRH